MKYFEVILDTSSELIETRCGELEELGVSGFIIEDETDFRSFLDNNRITASMSVRTLR